MAKPGSLTHRTLHGFKWSYLSITLQAALQLGFLAAMARLLSPKDFGVVGIAAMFTTLVERVGYLGIGQALVQRPRLERDDPAIAATISIIVGLLLCAGFYLAAPTIAAFFKARALLPVMRLFSLVFLLEGFCCISESLLQRSIRFKALLVVNNVSTTAGNLAGVAFAWFGCGLWSLVYGCLAARAVRLVMLARVSPVIPTCHCPLHRVRELVRAGLGFSAARVLNYLAVTADNFIVGRRLGAGALGLYERAYQLMTVPSIYFGQVLEKVLFPAMSQRQSTPQRLRQVYLLGIEAAALVGIPGSVLLFVTARETVLLIFGSRWLPVVPTLQILAFGTFFRLCYKNSDTLIRSLGAVNKLAIRQLVYLFLICVGAFFGCREGIPGVGFAVSCAVAIHYFLLAGTALKLLGIARGQFLRAHLPGLWVALWTLAGSYPLAGQLRASAASPFVVFCTVCGAAFLAGFAALAFLPVQIRPQLFTWVQRTFALERYGPAGSALVWMLGEAPGRAAAESAHARAAV